MYANTHARARARARVHDGYLSLQCVLAAGDWHLVLIEYVCLKLLKQVNGYVSDKQQLRIQIEWDETLLLFQATYHKYDDVSRIHNYQMR